MKFLLPIALLFFGVYMVVSIPLLKFILYTLAFKSHDSLWKKHTCFKLSVKKQATLLLLDALIEISKSVMNLLSLVVSLKWLIL